MHELTLRNFVISNQLYLSTQSDQIALFFIPFSIVRTKFYDTTALGVAFAAGQSIGMDMCCLESGYYDW